MSNATTFKLNQLTSSILEHTVLKDAKYINIRKYVCYKPATVTSTLLYSRKLGLFTTKYQFDTDEELICSNVNVKFLTLYLLKVVNNLFIQSYAHGTTFWSMTDAHLSICIPNISLSDQDEYITKYQIIFNSQARQMC
jgi:hypothetical protein